MLLAFVSSKYVISQLRACVSGCVVLYSVSILPQILQCNTFPLPSLSLNTFHTFAHFRSTFVQDKAGHCFPLEMDLQSSQEGQTVGIGIRPHPFSGSVTDADVPRCIIWTYCKEISPNPLVTTTIASIMDPQKPSIEPELPLATQRASWIRYWQTVVSCLSRISPNWPTELQKWTITTHCYNDRDEDTVLEVSDELCFQAVLQHMANQGCRQVRFDLTG